jgi:hypothetical protein
MNGRTSQWVLLGDTWAGEAARLIERSRTASDASASRDKDIHLFDGITTDIRR